MQMKIRDVICHLEGIGYAGIAQSQSIEIIEMEGGVGKRVMKDF